VQFGAAEGKEGQNRAQKTLQQHQREKTRRGRKGVVGVGLVGAKIGRSSEKMMSEQIKKEQGSYSQTIEVVEGGRSCHWQPWPRETSTVAGTQK